MPIVADEARIFGMANLFKQIGIYSSVGQRYEPEDIGSILSHLSAASVPNCRAYDPAFAGEFAVIPRPRHAPDA